MRCTSTLITLFALLAVYLVNVTTAEGRSNATEGKRPFEWGPCDQALVQDPAISCGFFDIPLDYHDPEAGRGRLAVAKANATGERCGTVFINPGGPRSSGLAALNEGRDFLLEITGGEYDIVSWDTRGVGPLTVPGDIFCFDSMEEYNTFWNGTIELNGIEYTGNFTDPEDIQTFLSQANTMQHKYEELGQRCLHHPTGKFLKHVGTAATVRDMVALADALDGPGAKVNYAGISYGTVVGVWLVNMFPERVGRVILDGVLSSHLIATANTPSIWLQQTVDTNKVYEAFVTGCALTGPTGCTLASNNSTPADINESIQEILRQAHDATRRDAAVPVTSAAIRLGLLSAMFFPDEWATLINTTYPGILAAVKEESQSGLSLSGFTPRALRKRQANETRSYGGVAIACSDSIDPRSTHMIDIFRNIIATTNTGTNMFAAVWGTPYEYCPFWPVRAVERYQGPFNKKLSNKVLIVSNLLDPVTPLNAAQALADTLGDSATLVVQEGFGHTSIGSPSNCLNEIMFAYMTHGTLPDDNDTKCAVDPDFDIFNGVNTEAIVEALATSQ